MALILSGENVHALVNNFSGDGANWDYTDRTILMWVKQSSSGNADTYPTIFAIAQDTSRSFEHSWGPAGANFTAYRKNGDSATIGAVANDTWKVLGVGLFLEVPATLRRYTYFGTGADVTRTLVSGDWLSVVSGLDTLRLGRMSDAQADSQWNGKLAHLRFYNKLLSEAEAESEMSSTTALDASCVAAWSFQNNTVGGNSQVGSWEFVRTETSGTATYAEDDEPIAYGASAAMPKTAGPFGGPFSRLIG